MMRTHANPPVCLSVCPVNCIVMMPRTPQGRKERTQQKSLYCILYLYCFVMKCGAGPTTVIKYHTVMIRVFGLVNCYGRSCGLFLCQLLVCVLIFLSLSLSLSLSRLCLRLASQRIIR